MKVLVLGSGAREHALAWKFAQSNRISGLFIAPGNAGTEEQGVNLPRLDLTDGDAVLKVCRDRSINMVFVGPEEPLANGIVDILSKSSIDVIGPGKNAAQLESSKAFSKAFMKTHGIPTAGAKEFDDEAAFEKYITRKKGRFVIKKSGLAAGKGVLESEDKNSMIEFGKKILENDKLLVEDYLEGWEISVFALSDGSNYTLLPFCADFKKSCDGDLGENTGGMGAICPVPRVSDAQAKTIVEKIVEPTFAGLRKEGLLYKGVVYFGIMVTKNGPKLLEYNVRFGDPETQVLIPLIKSDLVSICEAILNGSIDKFRLQISTDSALGVVVASAGYPHEYATGIPVEHLPKQNAKNPLVFHASTKKDSDGRTLTGGGRCFTVVGIGKNTVSANHSAYKAVPEVVFDGAWSRQDIGKKFFIYE